MKNYFITLFLVAACAFVSCDDEDEDNVIPMSSNVEAVDLGLSVKWANVNIGAEIAADYGAYFMWGHTEDCSNSICDDEHCKTFVDDIEDWSGNAQYDAATANWGSKWRTPTEEEMEELTDECDWTWAEQTNSQGESVKGYKIVGPNGNSIFLPTAGYRHYTLFDDQDSDGYYWTSSPGKLTITTNDVYYLRFNQYVQLVSSSYDYYSSYNGSRYRSHGIPVRPVLAQ